MFTTVGSLYSVAVPDIVKYVEPVAVVVAALVLIALVHAWSGDEQSVCDGAPCPVGSGASWLLTGAGLAAPPSVWAGLAWTRRLHRNDDLGPFARRAVPDIEEIAEIAMVLVAVGVTYLLIRNGPRAPMVEANWPNSWLEDRLGRDGRHPLVPARSTWFVVGAVLAAPVSFSAGTAVGREWFGRRPRPSVELVEE